MSLEDIPERIAVVIPLLNFRAREATGRGGVRIHLINREELHEGLLKHMMKLHDSGFMKIHCFIIDKRWISHEEGERFSSEDQLDAWRWIQNECLPLFTFAGFPVYLVDKVESGFLLSTSSLPKGIIAVL